MLRGDARRRWLGDHENGGGWKDGGAETCRRIVEVRENVVLEAGGREKRQKDKRTSQHHDEVSDKSVFYILSRHETDHFGCVLLRHSLL